MSDFVLSMNPSTAARSGAGELRIGLQPNQEIIGNCGNCVVSAEAGVERIRHLPSSDRMVGQSRRACS
jgi:hypothetical protein